MSLKSAANLKYALSYCECGQTKHVKAVRCRDCFVVWRSENKKKPAPCVRCGKKKPAVQGKKLCEECAGGTTSRQMSFAYRRRYMLKKKYGLQPGDFERMESEQDGRCAICLGQAKDGSPLCVDHCHATGTVRKLLCTRCNQALGLFNEDTSVLQNAIEYINAHR